MLYLLLFKVIGYLNLLANCSDNFTHGLAVAGSFLVSVPVSVYDSLNTLTVCRPNNRVSTKIGYSVNMLLLCNFLYNHSYI